MEYFHLGIFVIPRAYLISTNGSQTQAFFFVFHKFFDTVTEFVIALGSEMCYFSDIFE